MKKLLTIAGLVSVLGVGFLFAAPATQFTVTSVSVGSQTGTLTAGTAGSVTYNVTVLGNDGGGALKTTLTVSGLPSGVSYSPSTQQNCSTATCTVTLTLTSTAAASAVSNQSFTINAVGNGSPAGSATTTGSLTIGAAVVKTNPTLSVTNSPVIYNAAPQSATVTGSVAGTVSNIKYNGSATVPTNAGTYAVTANFTPTDTTNYNSLTNASAGNFVISKATPTLSVTNSPVSYTGSAQTAIVTSSASGTVSSILVGGAANQTNVGTYAVTANFTPTDTTDYNSLTGASAGNFVINKINTTTTVACPGTAQVYTGSAQTPCTVSVTGTGLSLTPAAIYTNNVNAGTASASYTYAGDANYNGSSDTKTFTISKAAATINVSGYSGTYDAASHGATGSATGVMSEDLSSSLSLGSSFTDVPGGFANWTFSNANYNSQSNSVAISIGAATVTPSVTVTSTKTYDGSTAATVTGCTLTGIINGDDVTCSAAGATYADANVGTGKTVTATGITLGGTKAGNYQLSATTATTSASITARGITVTADSGLTKVYGTTDPAFTYHVTSGSLAGTDTFSGALSRDSGENVGTYNITQGTLNLGSNYVITFVGSTFGITQANAPITIDSTTLNPNYDGTAHAVTAATTPSNITYSVTYNGSTTTPTNAGTYAVVATITDPNYSGTDSGTLTIHKATPSITVTPYSVTYDGSAHTASVTATGAQGEDLSSSVDLSGTTHTNAGTYNGDAWTFTDTTGNYNNANGTVNDAIAKAVPGITISNNSYFWDGTAKTVTVTTTPASLAYTVTYNGLGTAPSAIGTYAVNVDVNDTNYAGTATDTLTIKNNPPVVTVLGSNPLYYTQNYNNVVDPGATATDVEDGNAIGTPTPDKQITADQVGTYLVTYSVTDSNGATATATRTVNIVPQLSGAGGPTGKVGCMDATATNYDPTAGYPGSCTYPQVLGAATSTDGTLIGALNATSTPSSKGKGQVLGASNYKFSRDLKLGSRGEDVLELQKILWDEGFFKNAEMTTYFGPVTKAALIQWQKAHKISPASGYFGQLSRKFLSQ